MPSNVSIEYAKAEAKLVEARTQLEKLAVLEEMNRYAPKHKGAEKLRAGISHKIAKLKREIEKEKLVASKRGGSGSAISVKKEGSSQIVIVGLPNTGKSTLLKKLTGVDVEIASYEFTTTKPELGMMNYHGAMIQLVELPSIIEGSSTGKAQGTQILSVARTSDAIVICASNKEEVKVIENELSRARIIVNEEKPNLVIKQSQFKGITLTGKKKLQVPLEQLISFLNNAGIRQANIIINEKKATLDMFARVLDNRIVYKKSVVINPFDNEDTETLKDRLFSLLGKILVYTKKPGEEADLSLPLVVDVGSNVEVIARIVHKEMATHLKHAKVWGSTKFDGQHVSKDYILHNKDIVEVSA